MTADAQVEPRFNKSPAKAQDGRTDLAIPAEGDLCITPVYLLKKAIFSVIPVKLAPYSDTGTGI